MYMQFGIPSKRKRKEEDPTPKMTLEYDGEKGTGRKIMLNTAACNLLNIEDSEDNFIAFSFDNEMKIPAIVNASNNPTMFEDAALHLTKSKPYSINSARYYNYILEYFEVENIIGKFNFLLEGTDTVNVCKFSLIEDLSNSEIEDEELYTENGGEVSEEEREQILEEQL